ncbi:Fanconi anemia group I protein homolog [Amyelois transitella]|uniref:Fanconi anemia group I protein homolog n=1 Tax=Amyelois transitella TaxID=680683 RepID=UPI00067DCBC2|nr:Fanconi anemia group I protein homolog [Amyelois transitella]
MDIKKLYIKLKELGHANSKREELREYCKQNLDQLLTSLPRRIISSDGSVILDCLFNGIPDKPIASLKYKVKIANIVLDTMRKEATSLSHCSDVISRLCLELPRLPAEDLVRWCNDSVQSIVDDADENMIWKDVLPECLTALSSESTVKHCGTELSVSEFKEQCVHALCQCRWKEKHLVQLAAMFNDMRLGRNEHRQAVNKLCSYIIDVPPDTLPPLVHQLLKLCKVYDVEVVLAHLSHYFGVRLYSKLDPPPQDSESTTMDIDDIVPYSSSELSSCLSTCLYHITQGSTELELIRKHLKLWPKTQLLRAPFMLDIALALSDKGTEFRSVCLDVIKSAIELRIQDEVRSKESSWVRSVVPPDVDVASVLKVLTTESAKHRNLTVMGLINLAIVLLSVPRTKPMAPSCWSYGKLILVRFSKAQPETASHILSLLADRLAGECQKQYADCLHLLCKLTPVSVERCTQLRAILECCQPSQTDYRPAAAVLDAVHPLINFSIRTRDTLVMVCRKGMYSRDPLHRCLALSGFLSVLRHVRVNSPPAWSSSQGGSEQYSAHSYLTQICVDLHVTCPPTVSSRVRNEAMCLEVISILRRCLVQDASVKQLLYSKIYDCIKDKPTLHEAILELFYEQFTKYLPEDGDTALKWEKCVQVNATSAVLAEPMGYLLYVIAEFVQPVEEELEDILGSQNEEQNAVFIKTKLINLLDKQEMFTTGIDMEDLGLSDITPESKAKSLKVQQILQCYEAIIAHRIMQWNVNSTDEANRVYSLYKSHSQLMEHAKTAPKSAKKGNKHNETKETQKSQKSQKSQKEKKGKTPAKFSNLVKDRAGPFKPLPCVWNLAMCHRVIQLLYGDDVSWSSPQQRDYIRSRRDFHQWALKSILSTISSEDLEKRDLLAHGVGIATIMYSKCVTRYQDMCTFDEQTALECLDLFRACLNMLLSPNYSLKLESFLPAIIGMQEASPASCVAAILEKIHEALTLASEESAGEENDSGLKKTVAALSQLAELCLSIPGLYSSEMSSAIIKLEQYIRTSKVDCLSMVPSLLTASYREHQEATFLDELLSKLSASLGRIDEEDTSAGDEESQQFPSIDSRAGHAVLSHVCTHLAARLRCVEHLISRARDLTAAVANAQHNQQRIDRELKELYKSIVIQLCQLTNWISSACKLRCNIGSGTEKVVGTVVKLYNVLGALAKCITVEIAVLARFERLLKLSGKKLSTITDNLITYLEASQQQQSASKVLRDTKLVPRLVLQCEQFSKHVILLANKGKLNYQQYLSLGTARDFRIKAPVLQEALNARENRVDETSDNEEQVNINDAETEILERGSASEVSDEEEEDKRKKRRRVS